MLDFYTLGKVPSKSHNAVARFKKHTKMFTYDEDKKKIYLIADNLPEGDALENIAELPLKLEILDPTNESVITNIIADY